MTAAPYFLFSHKRAGAIPNAPVKATALVAANTVSGHLVGTHHRLVSMTACAGWTGHHSEPVMSAEQVTRPISVRPRNRGFDNVTPLFQPNRIPSAAGQSTFPARRISTVAAPAMLQTRFHGGTRMPDRVHPLDESILDLGCFRRRLERRLWADGRLDPDEADDLALFDRAFTTEVEFRARQRLGRMIEDGAAMGTRYMNEHAVRVGARISRLEDATEERTARVIRLNDHRQTDPNEAA